MKSIKKSLVTESRYIGIFFLWFIGILLFALIATNILPNQKDYLGGGLSNYMRLPLFWGFSNFDGEHYVSIAQNGYAPLQHFFFPVYPLLIRIISTVLGHSLFLYNLSGILVSFVSTAIFLIGLVQLLKIDYSDKVTELTILLLVLSPASFFFFMVYTESLFLSLTVWCLYFSRRRLFLPAVILASIASATKVIGFSLGVAILFEILAPSWPMKNVFEVVKKNIKELLLVLFSTTGLFVYMAFLQKETGDALVFLHKISVFGDQRSSTLIFLPQVFYRYVFKIIPNLTNYWPTTFTTLLEFAVAVLFLLICIFSFRTLRKSHWIYLVIGFLIPTLAGSFSSLPRYVIVLFPAFLYLATLLENKKKAYTYIVFAIFGLLQIISLMLFFRGYWLS
ncbi:hypothetical protein KBA63_05610 [Candidatus Woesebacteria bacterium]|jgi:hypothetical protein|nr:hypothetical protein [Candidatus Woesebacteria bacterium]